MRKPVEGKDSMISDETEWAINQNRFYEDWQRAIDAGETPDPCPFQPIEELESKGGELNA